MAEPAAIAERPPGRADGRSSARRGPETRELIHEAAISLFAELGYHATSMRAIAAAAGIRPAAIYHWYPAKEAILVRLQDDFMERLEARLSAAMGAHEVPAIRLAAAVREHVVFHGLHAKAAFVTDSEIRALGAEARAALIARRDRYQDVFIREIEAGVADGTLRVSDARIAAYTTLLGCTGVALWFDPAAALGLERVAELHVELVLASLGAPAGLIADALERVSA